MSVARTRSAALTGVDGRIVDVEADVNRGVVGLHLIGMLDTALKEARDRVRSAVLNSGFGWPDRRIAVSLFPASVPKFGSSFDLPIAIALLGAAGVIDPNRIADPLFIGELGLDGKVRSVRGVLPAVLAAAEAGVDTVIVPSRNAAEASLVPGMTVIPAVTLAELVGWLIEGALGENAFIEGPDLAARIREAPRERALDLSDVAGQATARWAAEISAAGGHNLFLGGSPGTGKTMLAERLPGLHPPLDTQAQLEVTAIHSIAGTLPPDRPLIVEPPFCNPHHSASVAAIIGGGSHGMMRPGAVSLAHHGLLFLDEAPEFNRSALESLRQPLERGEVVVARAAGTVTFPARFTLVLAANPCPCARTEQRCECPPGRRVRYKARLSGPLLDRIDLKVNMSPSTRRELLHDRHFTESSAVVAERVRLARERSAKRLAGTPWRTNAEIPARALRKQFAPEPGSTQKVEGAIDLGTLSARGVDRIIRVAWTLADLGGRDRPGASDVETAHGLWTGEIQ